MRHRLIVRSKNKSLEKQSAIKELQIWVLSKDFASISMKNLQRYQLRTTTESDKAVKPLK